MLRRFSDRALEIIVLLACRKLWKLVLLCDIMYVKYLMGGFCYGTC